ncbi:MAG: hypothetical protein PHN18_04970 [Sulfurospirillaceae bacterium]|nr:hypothetical protein [Sulfurospirillaceae bacterium]MDD2825660.1 hypothetical protein [Sulfurospirillaceae bacterium]
MIKQFCLALVSLFLLVGCGVKEANLAIIAPQVLPLEGKEISVYDTINDRITFYNYVNKDGKLLEKSWSTILPFRITFMEMWASGLGHDLRRLSHNQAETVKDTLMYGAREKGMISLHKDKNDYILDNTFAHDLSDAIKAFEEQMRRYERNDDLPYILKKH